MREEGKGGGTGEYFVHLCPAGIMGGKKREGGERTQCF